MVKVEYWYWTNIGIERLPIRPTYPPGALFNFDSLPEKPLRRGIQESNSSPFLNRR
jgi:hypothetical protein